MEGDGLEKKMFRDKVEDMGVLVDEGLECSVVWKRKPHWSGGRTLPV